MFFKGALDSMTYTGDRAAMVGAPVVEKESLAWEPVRLAAGDVLIYGNNMPHYSDENNSQRDRRALFAVYTDVRHGEAQRAAYYAAEAEGRRKEGSAREGGKANGFFTGQAVLQGAA